MSKRITAVVLSLGLTITWATPGHASQEKIDTSKPMVVNLQVCSTQSELDCIESFDILEPTTSRLEYLGFLPRDPRVDEHGNSHYNGVERYLVNGTPVNLWVELQSPQMVIFEHNGKKFRGSSMRTYIQAPEMFDHKFEIKIRTSWLRPQDIQLHAVSADYKIEKIPNGTRWTFSGFQQTLSGYSGDWLTKLANGSNADSDWHRLDFLVHHLGKGGSYFDETCGDKGFTVESHNAPGAGMPFWDGQSLNFAIQSPHANSKGVPIVGYFRLWMPESYLNCKWPQNNISSSATIQVLVQNEDGSYQVASTTVGRSKGIIRVEAYGFHYSAPKIKIVGSKKPLSQEISRFTQDGFRLSPVQQSEISSLVRDIRPRRVTCSVLYSEDSQKKLATKRASEACKFSKKIRQTVSTRVNIAKTTNAEDDGKIILSVIK